MAFAQVDKDTVSAIQEGVGDESWIPCGGAVAIGWKYDGINFSAPLQPAPPAPTLQNLAEQALNKSDAVAIRCVKAGIPYPSAWLNRDEALRAIVNGSDTISTSLPPVPPYPAGT